LKGLPFFSLVSTLSFFPTIGSPIPTLRLSCANRQSVSHVLHFISSCPTIFWNGSS
jgi:hypothetical protein